MHYTQIKITVHCTSSSVPDGVQIERLRVKESGRRAGQGTLLPLDPYDLAMTDPSWTSRCAPGNTERACMVLVEVA